jgi:hypothetical protein
MLLRIVENDTFRDIPVKEGEMFLLPGTYSKFPLDYADTGRKHAPQPRQIQRYHRSSYGTTTTGGISRSPAMVLYQGKPFLAHNHPRGGLSLLGSRDTTETDH